MAFATGYLANPNKVGSGERYDVKSDVVLSASTFEDSLVVGRFAKMASGSLDNLDGSATPVIAGVVLRKGSNPIESGSVVDADLYSVVEYGRSGLFTVEAKAGEVPVKFGAVYASNAATHYGKATVTGTDIATRAEYIETIDTNVWLVRLY